MNERIKKLEEQSVFFNEDAETWEFDRKKFAELIVQECISACATDRLGKTAGAEELIKQHFGVEE